MNSQCFCLLPQCWHHSVWALWASLVPLWHVEVSSLSLEMDTNIGKSGVSHTHTHTPEEPSLPSHPLRYYPFLYQNERTLSLLFICWSGPSIPKNVEVGELILFKIHSRFLTTGLLWGCCSSQGLKPQSGLEHTSPGASEC